MRGVIIPGRSGGGGGDGDAAQFGVGVASPAVSDLDDTAMGSFTTSSSATEGDVDTAHTPSLGGADTQARWFNVVSFGVGARLSQIASHVFAAGSDKHRGRLFTRVKHDADWHGWYELYHQNTILGPVSQDAGRPTGAIIERGSNANGEYVRFADGTQICVSPEITGDVTTPVGALFRWDSSQTWDFPAAFPEAPVVAGAGATTEWNCLSTTRLSKKTFVLVNVLSPLSLTARSAQFVAVGRWY